MKSLSLQIPPQYITGAMSGKGEMDKDIRVDRRELEGNTNLLKNLKSASLPWSL